MANVINFNDDDKKDQQGQLAPSSGQSSTITPVSNFNAQQSVPQPQQSSSSGQFTNIQKYLQANKGAGQQIAGNVNKQMDKSLQGNKVAQEEATKAFQSGVQQANDVFGRGQQYAQQLQAPVQQTRGIITGQQQPGQVGFFGDRSEGPVMTAEQAQAATQQQQPIQPVTPFNPNSIVNDQNSLLDFTKIRTGLGVNEEQLANQANQAQSLAGQGQTQAQGLLDRSKTAQGRSGLINETFNRPNYTQGQQRLDSLFLTGAGKQGINTIQNKAKENLGQATNIYGQATSGVNQAGEIKTREQQLQQDLQNRANALETGYISNLESLIPEVNQMRDADRARWQNNFDILTGKKQGTIDQDIFNELQLRSGERSYNVLNDPNLSLQQIAQISARNAANVGDVARQEDVDYYNALAKLAKGTISPEGTFAGPMQDQLLLSKASDLDKAVQSQTGENSLRNRLNKAEQDFIQKSLSTNITGYGSDTGSSGLLGSGGIAESQLSLNLANYLKQNGLLEDNSLNQTAGGANYAQMGTDVSLLNAPTRLASALMPNTAIGDLTGNFSNLPGSLASGFGLTGNAGSSVAAAARARQNLLDNLFSTLKSSGYNNYVTTGGNVNTDDLAQQARNIETQRLSDRNDNKYYVNPLNTEEQKQAYARTVAGQNLENLLAGKELQNTNKQYTDAQVEDMKRQYADKQLQASESLGNKIDGMYYNQLSPEQKSAAIQNYINSAYLFDTGGLASQGSLKNIGQDQLNEVLKGRTETENKYNQMQEANAAALRARLGLNT